MRNLVILVASLLVTSALGCSPMSAAKSAGSVAFQTMRGPQADAMLIRGLNPGILPLYKSIQIGKVTTDVPPICDAEVMTDVRKGIVEELGSKSVRKVFPGSGQTMRIDVTCRFYKKKGMIGGEGRLDWLVHLQDAASDEEIGLVFIEGVSESPLEHGADDMAEENTKELVKFLSKRIKGMD